MPVLQPAQFKVSLPTSTVRLENGLVLVMHVDTTVSDVGVELFVRGGAREEAPGQFGTAHLLEHNLPQPVRFLSNPENRAVRSVTVGNRGAGTEPDFLRFYLEAKAEGLNSALAFLADRM